MALSNNERIIRYRAKLLTDPQRYKEINNKRNETRRKRWYYIHYGDYIKADHCEKCGKVPLFSINGPTRLIAHHTHYKSCVLCMPKYPKSGKCHRPDHLMTVCMSCHKTIHYHDEQDYRWEKDIQQQNRHLAEIAAD